MQIFERLTSHLNVNDKFTGYHKCDNKKTTSFKKVIANISPHLLVSSNASDLFPSVFIHINRDSLQFCPSKPRGILCTVHPLPMIPIIIYSCDIPVERLLRYVPGKSKC